MERDLTNQCVRTVDANNTVFGLDFVSKQHIKLNMNVVADRSGMNE